MKRSGSGVQATLIPARDKDQVVRLTVRPLTAPTEHTASTEQQGSSTSELVMMR